MLPLAPVAVCCALAAISALAVVLMRRPVHVAVALLGHSLSLAALYLSLTATFSAVAQTLIYSGAIVVLFLIVVALLPTGGKESLPLSKIVAGVIVFGSMIAAMTAALATTVQTQNTVMPDAKGDGFDVVAVGAPLFESKQLLLSFELTAPLLLAAI